MFVLLLRFFLVRSLILLTFHGRPRLHPLYRLYRGPWNELLPRRQIPFLCGVVEICVFVLIKKQFVVWVLCTI